MEQFRAILQVLTVASLFLAAAQIYLTLNKLWNRKHERVVAESISIMGETLGLVPMFFLTVTFILDAQWEGMIDGALWLFAGAVTILIGSGRWVEGKRGRGFWTLIRESVVMERDEVGELAKSFLRPSAAKIVLDILGQITMLDAHIDERERRFIESFADAWGLDFHLDEAARSSQAHPAPADRGGSGPATGVDYLRLRGTVGDYLATSPPDQQVIELRDVISALVRVDEEVSAEEELMLTELTGMFDQYLTRKTDHDLFGVAVVPQSPEQDSAIAALLPAIPRRPVAGGHAYVVGPYFSRSFADIVGQQYRALGFFTAAVRMDASG